MKTKQLICPCRVIMIGLDGATFDLLLPWTQDGKLPALSRILEEGAWAASASTVPPNTAPAWSSIATGKNPGKHGVFEFFRMNRNGYLSPINSDSILAKTLWDIAGQAGKKTICLNFPLTYPPHPINGLMVTGFPTPSTARNFTYPPNLSEAIKKMVNDYSIMPRKTYVKGKVEEFIKELHYCVDRKIKLMRYLMERYEWDLLIQVFSETDIIQHGLWQCLDPNHPHYDPDEAAAYGDAILELYQKLDRFIGELESHLDENTVLLILSDHGMGPLYKYVHINNWLIKEGYLRAKLNPISLVKYWMFRLGITPMNVYALVNRIGLGGVTKTALRGTETAYTLARKLFFDFTDIDWSRTKAYSIGGGTAGLIFVNLEGREPYGSVSPGKEYEEVLDEIIAALRRFKNPVTGEPMTKEIYRKEEIYSGPYLSEGPDIVYIQRDPRYINYSNFAFSSNRIIDDAPSYVSAQHRENGILMLKGPVIKPSVRLGKANVTDIAPTVLHLLGLAIPTDMDGKVLTEAFNDDFLRDNPVRYTEETQEQDVHKPEFLGKEEEEEITARLRDLGYI